MLEVILDLTLSIEYEFRQTVMDALGTCFHWRALGDLSALPLNVHWHDNLHLPPPKKLPLSNRSAVTGIKE